MDLVKYLIPIFVWCPAYIVFDLMWEFHICRISYGGDDVSWVPTLKLVSVFYVGTGTSKKLNWICKISNLKLITFWNTNYMRCRTIHDKQIICLGNYHPGWQLTNQITIQLHKLLPLCGNVVNVQISTFLLWTRITEFESC